MEKQFSVVDSAVGNQDGNEEKMTESRNYVLNETKSMSKKLAAAEKPCFTITETGGGIKLNFNSGMYELFKIATNEFFSSDQMKNSCKTVGVTDKKSSSIETKYKVTGGKKCHYYMLNMYHTTCSCLVNGKNTEQFVKKDIHEIFKLIERHLLSKNCTLDQFNKNIKELITQYFKNETTSKKELNNSTLDACFATASASTKENSSRTESTASADSCDQSSDTSIQHPTCAISEETMDDSPDILTVQNGTEKDQSPVKGISNADLYKLLINLNLSVKEVRQTLRDHVTDTNMQFTQIRDDINNMKKRCSLSTETAGRQVEELSESTTQLQEEVKKASSTLERKMQSMFDTLKSISERNMHSVSCSKTSNPQTSNGAVGENEQRTNVTQEKTIEQDHHSNEAQSSQRRSQSNTTLTSNQSRTATTESLPQRKKVLIIGSSMVKGINPRGVDQNVTISVNRGADSRRIKGRLESMDLSHYKDVIIYAGGNDGPNGTPLHLTSANIQSAVRFAKNQGCNVSICLICPRVDTDVIPLNNMLKNISYKQNAQCIDVYTSLVNAGVNCFVRDGIHLNKTGNTILVHALDNVVSIIKKSKAQKVRSCETKSQFCFQHRKSAPENFYFAEPHSRSRTQDMYMYNDDYRSGWRPGQNRNPVSDRDRVHLNYASQVHCSKLRNGYGNDAYAYHKFDQDDYSSVSAIDASVYENYPYDRQTHHSGNDIFSSYSSNILTGYESVDHMYIDNSDHGHWYNQTMSGCAIDESIFNYDSNDNQNYYTG